MIDDDRISAWLDHEMSAMEAEAFSSEVAADPELAAEVEEFAAVRKLMRAGASVDPRDGVMELMMAKLTAADRETVGDVRAPVVGIESRRRVPTFAAVAASFAIIASVVGGLGGSTTLPAIGDLVARHDAAAAASSMPPSDDDVMHDVMAEGPVVPPGYELAHASSDDGVVHLIYSGRDGSMVSIFQQEGDTDVSQVEDEMGKGEVGEMAGAAMWTGSVGGDHVTVVDGDGYLWTIVGDADHDTMVVLMTDLPSRERSLVERLRGAADAAVEPFRLGW